MEKKEIGICFWACEPEPLGFDCPVFALYRAPRIRASVENPEPRIARRREVPKPGECPRGETLSGKDRGNQSGFCVYLVSPGGFEPPTLGL